MATKISTDIATVVDITARRNDSFYLKTDLTKDDGTNYNLIDSTDDNYKAKFEIYNGNDELILGFTSLTLNTSSSPLVDSTISVVTSSASLIINSPATNMTIRSGSYKYKFYIYSETDSETNTIMVGKFKVVDV